MNPGVEKKSVHKNSLAVPASAERAELGGTCGSWRDMRILAGHADLGGICGMRQNVPALVERGSGSREIRP